MTTQASLRNHRYGHSPPDIASSAPLAGKAHIGDDHFLAYSSFFACVPPAWNVLRALKVAPRSVLVTARS